MKLDKNYKVRVTSEQSRKIQELVFGLGGKWNGGTDWVINETIPFLYVTSGLVMTCDSKAQEYFSYASSENTEIQADDLIALLTDLSKSAEKPLQNIELTPEFEAVEPIFKVGNKVYVGLTGKIAQVTEIIDDEVVNVANKNNGVRAWISNICPATQENYERLQATFPHIEFEAPPKPLTGSDLARAMVDKGWFIVDCYVSAISDGDALRFRNKRMQVALFGDGLFTDGVKQFPFAVPFDSKTGEPLTESILDE